jgi:hypothetical protein
MKRDIHRRFRLPIVRKGSGSFVSTSSRRLNKIRLYVLRLGTNTSGWQTGYGGFFGIQAIAAVESYTVVLPFTVGCLSFRSWSLASIFLQSHRSCIHPIARIGLYSMIVLYSLEPPKWVKSVSRLSWGIILISEAFTRECLGIWNLMHDLLATPDSLR